VLEAALPASDYGMAAFVFRKDLREMLSTILQLLSSIERDAGVGKLQARKSAIALYYIAAYKRLERWAEPDSEELEHAEGRSGVIEQVSRASNTGVAPSVFCLRRTVCLLCATCRCRAGRQRAPRFKRACACVRALRIALCVTLREYSSCHFCVVCCSDLLLTSIP
jgi:hypothetical protein